MRTPYNINILVACETSGRIREAFRRRGFNAISVDLLPPEDDSPYHIQGDIADVLSRQGDYDLLVAHPTCRFLSNSGVRWLYKNGRRYERDEDGNIISENPIDRERYKEMEAGAEFFMSLLNTDIPHVAVENPIMHSFGKALIGRGPNQVTQPWMWGDFASKATCLWTRNLPLLDPTYKNTEACRIALGLPEGTKPKAEVHLASPGPNRWKERSRTYLGFAEAVAEQYGNFLLRK